MFVCPECKGRFSREKYIRNHLCINGIEIKPTQYAGKRLEQAIREAREKQYQ